MSNISVLALRVVTDFSTQLLDAEMSKEVKKPPVVEFMMPKTIFSPAAAGAEGKDSLLTELWDFGFS